MENAIENMDVVEVTDSNVIDTIKTTRCCNKKRSDENIIVVFLCKSCSDCKITIIH